MNPAALYLGMYWNRWLYRLTGRKPRLGERGCAQFYGYEREGGYFYLTSPDLPGFRITLAPEQIQDIGTLTKAIQPALETYLSAYMHAQHANDTRISARISARIRRADLGHGRHPMNLTAELCTV